MEHGFKRVRRRVEGRGIEEGEAGPTEIIVRAVFAFVPHTPDFLFATVAPNVAVAESAFAELVRWGDGRLWRLGLDLCVRLSRQSLSRLSRLSLDECTRNTGLIVSRTNYPGGAVKSTGKLVRQVGQESVKHRLDLLGGDESVWIIGIEHFRNAVEYTPQPSFVVMATSPVGVHMAWRRRWMRGGWRERRAEHGRVGRNGESVGTERRGMGHASMMHTGVVVRPSTGLLGPGSVMDDGLQGRKRCTVHFLRRSPRGKFVFGLLSSYGFLSVFKVGIVAQGLVCVAFGETAVKLLIERLKLRVTSVYRFAELFDTRTFFIRTASPKGIGQLVTVLDTLVRLVLE